MKIGFMGAQSTGKTSTVESMKKLDFFKDFAVLESPSRRLAEKGLLVDGRTTPQQQMNMTLEKCAMDMKTAGTNCISDRTPLDYIAHTEVLFKNNVPGWEEISYEEFCRIKAVKDVVEALEKYDHIFYFPIYWDLVPDGVRSLDEEYRHRIDEMMNMEAERFELKGSLRYVQVPDASPEERALFVQAVVNFPSIIF